MKKLTKMSLEKLAKTMSVIPENEMNMYWGMYQGDCFWRCVAYILSGNPDFPPTEADAEIYALQYTADKFFNGNTEQAHEYLSSNSLGASIANSDAIDYAKNNTANLAGYGIVSLKIEDFPQLNLTPTGDNEWHAVILQSSSNPDKVKFYDPQGDQFIEVNKSDLTGEGDGINALDIFNGDWNL